MICTKRRMQLCTMLLILNLILIWGNSLMNGDISRAISDGVKDALRWMLSVETGMQEDGLLGENNLIRKLGHFTEFTALGLLLAWRFAMQRKSPWYPFLLGGAAACMDECIQLFVPGRSCELRDVCIDWGGVALGMLLLNIGYIYKGTVLKKKE